MMVKVVTDSASDIPPEMAKNLPITIVPLYIQLGNKTYRDGVDINPDKVYEELARGKEIPKTSASSPGDFIKVYDDLANETDQIISIHLSSGYSGTYNVATLAKDYVGDKCRVEVIDSNSASMGLGLVVIAAAKAAREGKNLDQIVDMVHHIIPRIHIFGKTEDFLSILKGRRLRLTGPLILLGKLSMALGIELLGEVYDGGKIRSPSWVFGRKRALNKLKRRTEGFIGIKEIAIIYSTMPDEAEILAEQLQSLVPRDHIYITRFGCVTSTYVGPGTLAVAFSSSREK